MIMIHWEYSFAKQKLNHTTLIVNRLWERSISLKLFFKNQTSMYTVKTAGTLSCIQYILFHFQLFFLALQVSDGTVWRMTSRRSKPHPMLERLPQLHRTVRSQVRRGISRHLRKGPFSRSIKFCKQIWVNRLKSTADAISNLFNMRKTRSSNDNCITMLPLQETVMRDPAESNFRHS